MLPQLPDSAHLLENLMDTLSDAIYFKDLESRFVLVNKACVDKHGWESVEYIKGKSDFDFFSQEHAEQAFADEQRIIETGESICGLEEKETWPDGHETWVSTTKMPLKNDDGEIIGTFGISRDITEHKEAELRANQYANEIRQITEEMEEEVRMAAEMQKNFSPSSFPIFPEEASPEDRCINFCHRSVLTRQVSGDYCAVIRLSPTEVGVFLCDISGVGVRAALGTALVRGVMEEVEPSCRHNPGTYLTRVSQLLRPLLFQENMLLNITAFAIVFDVSTGRLQMACANHPRPLLFRAGKEVDWLLGDASRCDPALASQEGLSYESMECQLELGDSVILYTDGLFTTRNSDGEVYGEQRLLDSARRLAKHPCKKLFQGLEDDALAFSKEGNFTDDVCLLGFQFKKLLSAD